MTWNTRAAVEHLKAFEFAMLESASPGPADRITREQHRALQRQVLRALDQDIAAQRGETR